MRTRAASRPPSDRREPIEHGGRTRRASRHRRIPGLPRSTRQALWLGAVAAGLAGSAWLAHQRARAAERAHPPQGTLLEIDGVRLHYVERGFGTPVVLLHGNGTLLDDFVTSGVLDRAARQHRVIAFDRPGFGYSTRPRRRSFSPQAQAALIGRALAALGVHQPIVVGHSWGTLVALAMALDAAASVRALVLASGFYFPEPRLDVALLSPPALPVVGDVLRFAVSPWVAQILWPRMLQTVFAPAPVPAHFAAFPKEMTWRPSQIRAAAAESALMLPAAFALQERYGELQVPTVIVAGADDHFVDPQHSIRLHETVAGSQLRLVPGVGHMLHHSASEVLVEAIERAERDAAAIAMPPGAASGDVEAAVPSHRPADGASAPGASTARGATISS